MKVLVLNCGSSSVKFQLIDTDSQALQAENEVVLVRGSIEKIGVPPSIFHIQRLNENPLRLPVMKDRLPPEETHVTDIHNHQEAVRYLLEVLTHSGKGVVSSPQEIQAVGHRVVHGGERFHQPALMNKDVLDEIKKCGEFAPLHNPHNLTGYYASFESLSHCPHVAVFDTAFHQTIPPKAFLYALPYEYYERHGIRRYGFHGTSHRYVASRAAGLMDRSYDSINLITCHLGNGSSIAAIQKGNVVDTSMGFTPLEGLMMGTRSGDLDPSIVLTLLEKHQGGTADVNAVLNKQSGLLGVSGISSDLRAVEQAAQQGHERAALAVQMYGYRIKKYIASYLGVLSGADGIVFTGGIGENSAHLRRLSCEGLGFMGIELDERKNQSCLGNEEDIASQTSALRILVIPTNEELLMARDTVQCIEKN